jgi:hypothetical protein
LAPSAALSRIEVARISDDAFDLARGPKGATLEFATQHADAAAEAFGGDRCESLNKTLDCRSRRRIDLAGSS